MNAIADSFNWNFNMSLYKRPQQNNILFASCEYGRFPLLCEIIKVRGTRDWNFGRFWKRIFAVVSI